MTPLEDREDTADFLRTARGHPLLDPRREVVVARAPGRLDLMGGIADYSGSLVLQMPIAEATFAAAQHDDAPVLRVVSGPRRYEMDTAELAAMAGYDAARAHFAAAGEGHWAAYAVGVVFVLMREKGLGLGGGLRLLIDSRVPLGKGVSSSAAIEVAAMQAVSHLLGAPLPPVELAMLCQKVENLVVGAPCGVMDQMASACGRRGRLLALRCQPADIRGHVELPEGVGIWGIDSGIRHAVSGADYGTVRTAAFMGRRILEDAAPGLTRGYLANVTPSAFAALADRLPVSMTGDEFLARFGGIDDAVTRVAPGRVYPVRSATAHPIGEHHRIRCFAELLRGTSDDETLTLLGEMMFQSHASYSACGLGSDGTDRLVEMVRDAGPARGLYGAKITGGGSGGTVAILGRADAGRAARALADQYARDTGREPYLFEGSSPGAAQAGVLRV